MSQCFGIHIKEEIHDDDCMVEEEATATVDYSNYTIKIECKEEDDVISVQDSNIEYPNKIEYNDETSRLQDDTNERAKPVADSLYNADGGEQKREEFASGTTQCPHCSYSSASGSALKRHILTHAAKPKKIVCDASRSEKQAGRSKKQSPSRSKKPPRRRKKWQPTEPEYWKSCDTCGYSTVYKCSMASHIETHFPPSERSIKCSYPDCSYSCARKQFMKSHLANKHQETQHLKKCPLCGYVTGRASQLKRHMATHTKTKLHPCTYPDCLYGATQKSQLTIHLAKVHHVGQHLNKCTQCGYVAGFSSILKKHEATHVKPFQCGYPDCGYSATRKEQLDAHCAVKHGELENLKKCPHCDFTTGWIALLKRHLDTHRPPYDRRFRCRFVGCSYGAAGKDLLKGHMVRKHGEVQYLKHCSQCDYSTTRSFDLKCHILKHSENQEIKREIEEHRGKGGLSPKK